MGPLDPGSAFGVLALSPAALRPGEIALIFVVLRDQTALFSHGDPY
jgi:hypothetical protein